MKTYAIALISLALFALFAATGVEAAAAGKKQRVCFGQFDGLKDCLAANPGNPRACAKTCHLQGYDKKYSCNDRATVDTACLDFCGTRHQPNGACTSRSLRAPTDGGACGYVWIEFSCQ